MITTVFFDWGGVLIDHNPVKLYGRLARQLGVAATDLMEEVGSVLSRFQRGLLGEMEVWQGVCSRLGVQVPNRPIWREAFEEMYTENSAVLDLAGTLRNESIGVGLISNTEAPISRLFLEKAASDLRYAAFHEPVFSCSVGLVKPDPEIFEFALSRHGAQAGRSVMIDDFKENIDAASRLGMETIHARNPAQIIRDLRDLLSARGHSTQLP